MSFVTLITNYCTVNVNVYVPEYWTSSVTNTRYRHRTVQSLFPVDCNVLFFLPFKMTKSTRKRIFVLFISADKVGCVI